MKKAMLFIFAVLLSAAAIASTTIPKNSISFDEAIVNLIDAPEDLSGVSIIVYPNPSYGKLFMDIRGTHDEVVYLKIYDTQGRQHVRMWVDSSATLQLDLSDLSPGLYLATINWNGEASTVQFALQ